MRISVGIVFLIALLVFQSCRKETAYTCYITNQTPYKIDKIELDCSAEEVILSVEPFSSTAMFELKFN
jgi:hypothetical protein